jgi:signal transduction histidine kinase
MGRSFQADIDAIQRISAVPRILEVVCRTTGMRLAAVARITDDSWVCCAVRDDLAFGLKPGDELEPETTICYAIRERNEMLVINNVAQDPVYRDHQTPAMYGFQSYISIPIKFTDGSIFGTLFAIDPQPAQLDTPETMGMFELFAGLIGYQLEAVERVVASEANLVNERQSSEQREQFIAVLGHDLRDPLTSIDAGANMLLEGPLDDRARNIVRLVKTSVARMSGMIDDVLDLARGRLGGGLMLDCNANAPLRPVLDQVVAESRARWPTRAIETQFQLNRPVSCDRQRIAQLLSNLLGNALTYGAPGQPIRIVATTSGATFRLSLSNGGEPIPPEAMERLFHPFSRGADRSNREGLGLGLYIASEIAAAHGGQLAVTSSAQETRFVFTMPLADIALG